VHFVFYNKQLTSGSPEGYSGRSNKRAVKILKYNSEGVKFAVDIFSMYTLLKLLLPPQNLSFYTPLKSRISQYIFLYQYILAETCVYIFATFVNLPYILEPNPHPFYGFRGLEYQMRIRIACGLDSRSRAGFWKNDRAAVRVVKTIQ